MLMSVNMRCRVKQHVEDLCLEHYFHLLSCQVVDPFVVIHIETKTWSIYQEKRVHLCWPQVQLRAGLAKEGFKRPMRQKA